MRRVAADYSSDLSGASATARLLDGLDGHVLALGDNAYENGRFDGTVQALWTGAP